MNFFRRKCVGLLAFLWITPASAACLTLGHSGTMPYWENHCSHAVYVSWTDNRHCGNWSCGGKVGALQRSTTSASGQVQWCEFNDGEFGKGPC